jgi:hypothetical protein
MQKNDLLDRRWKLEARILSVLWNVKLVDTTLQSLSTTIWYVPSSILWISLWFLLIHTLYILWSVFQACASILLIGCTYSKWNGKKCLIWLYHNNQTKICKSLFWNVIHAYRNSGYQQYQHLYQLEHLLWLNQVLLTLFFRNIDLAGHTGEIWWFWCQIQNLLKNWTQEMYRPTYVVSLWVNPILGLEYQNIHSKGDRSDMKIPSSDPESAHQIGPDDIWFMSFGGGNPTPSRCSKLICL